MTLAEPEKRDCFYKYYTADSAILTLKNFSRKWSNPIEFNDPFDNQFDFGTGVMLDILSKSIIEEFDLKTEYKVELKKFAIKAVKSALTGFNSGIKQSLSDTSIFCLSETKDNLLMWAHYADNHTGVVVKFKIVPETDSPLESIKKVFYTDKIPEFPKFNISNNVVPDIYSLKGYVEELINIISLTKSIHWNYEKEWRIISKLRDKTKTSEIIPFAPEEVADVYLGLKIDSKNKQEIIEITKKHYPQAGIYQAVKSKDKYELIFEQITG